MSYRLIDANEIAEKYPVVNEMECIYADLPNGLDGKHYTLVDNKPCAPVDTVSMMASADYKERFKSDRLSYIKSLYKYFDFTYLDKAVFFDEYFKDKNYSVVQVHDIRPCTEKYIEPIGFVGCFKWKNNILTPLDGDSYTAHMPIYGYQTFKDEEGKLCLDILTDEW